MNGLAQAAAPVSALAYIAAAPLEMFLFTKPWARRLLHVEAQNVDDVRMWAFVVGVRNLLAGLGVLLGLVLIHAGDAAVGQVVVLTSAGYMVLASLAMGIADLLGLWRPRGGSVRGTIASTVPPLIAIVAAT